MFATTSRKSNPRASSRETAFRTARTSEPAEASPRSAAGVRDLSGSGHPLPETVRSYFEPRFGLGLSHVRLHTGPAAGRTARDLRARAFTFGPDIAFAPGEYAPHTGAGRRLLAHELTHTVQQARGNPRQVVQREEDEDFQPWPGQQGTDVAGTVSTSGNVVSGRVQRTDDPAYADPMPMLIEFDTSARKLTVTQDIDFVHPSDASARLSQPDFDALKARIISVANDRLNGWITLTAGSEQSCPQACRGQEIAVRVVARARAGADAATVELRAGTGRANAGRIYAGGSDWLSNLFGGVSDGTLWHEAGHIVLGLPDEYRAAASSRVNQSDWSVMASHSSFRRRTIMHPRHFSFIPAWLQRRFPGCTFELRATDLPFVVDFVARFSMFGGGVGGTEGAWGGEMLELAAGLPLDAQRRWRLMVGGSGSILGKLQLDDHTGGLWMAGALVGLDYSTNRSAGGFNVGIHARGGLAGTFGGDVGGSVAGGLSLGYAGPIFEAGAFGEAGALFGSDLPEDVRGSPYFIAGLRAGVSF